MSWADGEVTITHYFGGDLGRAGLEEIFGSFKEATGTTVVDSPIGHEDFKSRHPGAGRRRQPAGRVQLLGRSADAVRGRRGHPWARSTTCGPSTAWMTVVAAVGGRHGATMYNGARYLVPFGYHYAGMFYNSKVMADAGGHRVPDRLGRVPGACARTSSRKASHRSRSAP